VFENPFITGVPGGFSIVFYIRVQNSGDTRVPFRHHLIESQPFSKRMKSTSQGALPRFGVIKEKDLVYFVYFRLIYIILKHIYEESSSVTVLKQS
jgi:hypothetical protein